MILELMSWMWGRRMARTQASAKKRDLSAIVLDGPVDLSIDRTAWSIHSAARTLTHVSGLRVEMVPHEHGSWCPTLRQCPNTMGVAESLALMIVATKLWSDAWNMAAQWQRCAMWRDRGSDQDLCDESRPHA